MDNTLALALLPHIPRGMNHRQLLTVKTAALLLRTSERQIMASIHELITHYGVPVGAKRSSPCGYYIMTNEDERQAGLLPIENQANDMTKRVAALRHASLDPATWQANVAQIHHSDQLKQQN